MTMNKTEPNMMIKHVLLSLILAFLSMNRSNAQECGTKIPPGVFKQAQSMALAMDTNYFIPHRLLPNINLSISVYISGKGYDSTLIYDAVNSLNVAFKPIGISFTACTISLMKGDEFKSLGNERMEKRITSLHRTERTINLYLLDSLALDGEQLCGYAYYPTPELHNYIFVKKDCDVANTLIHEMGHFFGLMHTHESSGGKEYVDESNCSVAGDLVCDTKASPNLYGAVSANCEYLYSFTDPHGDYYVPSVSNYMSYSLSSCRCRFTPGQYKRMVENYWAYLTLLR